MCFSYFQPFSSPKIWSSWQKAVLRFFYKLQNHFFCTYTLSRLFELPQLQRSCARPMISRKEIIIYPLSFFDRLPWVIETFFPLPHRPKLKMRNTHSPEDQEILKFFDEAHIFLCFLDTEDSDSISFWEASRYLGTANGDYFLIPYSSLKTPARLWRSIESTICLKFLDLLDFSPFSGT